MTLAALQSDFRRWLTGEAADVEDRIGEREAPGLAVYLNNYRGQLAACLTENFSAVHAWLGDEAFDRAAATHIDRVPPHSWTLDAYALDFPETIDRLFPEDPEVSDLARLERDLGVAFVGPDRAQLDKAALVYIEWDRAILDLVPTFSLRPVRTNAAAIWSAIHAGETPPTAAVLNEPAVIAMWRNGFAPVFRTLEPLEARALTMAADGRAFADICAAIADEVGAEEGPSVAGNLLGRWINDGLIGGVRDGLTTVGSSRS